MSLETVPFIPIEQLKIFPRIRWYAQLNPQELHSTTELTLRDLCAPVEIASGAQASVAPPMESVDFLSLSEQASHTPPQAQLLLLLPT